MARRRLRVSAAGFTLIEMLLVIAIMAIVAGLALPNSSPSIYDQLQSAAKIVAGDLAYARSLAVTHNSTYQVDFDRSENRYVLRHSGTDASLDILPDSPWRNADDPPDEQIVDLDTLPNVGVGVEIVAVAELGSSQLAVPDVEFGPLGETTSSAYTGIWLAAGEGTARRYMLLTVNPITGLVTFGAYTGESPEQCLSAALAL